MGNDASAPMLDPFAESLPQSPKIPKGLRSDLGGVHDWPVPPMVLYIDHLVLPQAHMNNGSSSFAASVRFDGEDVSDGLLFKLPSGPIPLLPREKGQCIQICVYQEESEKVNPFQLPSRSNETRTASQTQDGDRSASSIPRMAGNIWPYAEIECSISQLIHYGAPLYTSLWLGMRLGASEKKTEDLSEALDRARSHRSPKIKLTLFRPMEDIREKRAAARSQSPRAVSPRLANHDHRAEPDIENMLGQKSFFERDLWDNFTHVGIKDFRIAMVQGLIRCLDESNAVIQMLQEEANTYIGQVHGKFQAAERADSDEQVQSEAFRAVSQELRAFKLVLKTWGYEDLTPLAAGEALEAAMRRKTDEHETSLSQLRTEHEKQLRQLQDLMNAESEQSLVQAKSEFAQQLRETAAAQLREQHDLNEIALTEALQEMERRQAESVATQHRNDESTETMLAVRHQMREQEQSSATSLRLELDQMSQLHRDKHAELRDECERQKREALAVERISYEETLSWTKQEYERTVLEVQETANSEIERLKKEHDVNIESNRIAPQEIEKRLAESWRLELNRMSELHSQALVDLREELKRQKCEALAAERTSHEEALSRAMQDCRRKMLEVEEAAANEIEKQKKEYELSGEESRAAGQEEQNRLAESIRLEIQRMSEFHDQELADVRDESERQKCAAIAAERSSHTAAMSCAMHDCERKLREVQEAAVTEIERLKKEHEGRNEKFGGVSQQELEKSLAESLGPALNRMSELHNQELADLREEFEGQKRAAIMAERASHEEAMSCTMQDRDHKLLEAQEVVASEIERLKKEHKLSSEEFRAVQEEHERRLAESLRLELHRMSQRHNQELLDLRYESERHKCDAIAAERQSHSDAMARSMQDCERKVWEAQEAAAREIERLKKEREVARKEFGVGVAGRTRATELDALRDELEQRKREAIAVEQNSHKEAISLLMQNYEHKLREGQEAAAAEIERIKREHLERNEGFRVAQQEQEKALVEAKGELRQMSDLHKKQLTALRDDLERQKQEALAAEQQAHTKDMACMMQDNERRLREAQQAATSEIELLQKKYAASELRAGQAERSNSHGRSDTEAALGETAIARKAESPGSSASQGNFVDPLRSRIRSASPLGPASLTQLRANRTAAGRASNNTLPRATSQSQVKVPSVPLVASQGGYVSGGTSPRQRSAGTSPRPNAGGVHIITRKSSVPVPSPLPAVRVVCRSTAL